ncbi:and other transporter-domain-containing protein [Naematelia encephala]|uniref:And other transporter-domain-containing protein n=1 Tax=Naematelia encephala TaxID=71784 RepID=A0A1Y2AY35_9TREE|nr:and other transporter-domain-containing protein [Naematelia encephala]
MEPPLPQMEEIDDRGGLMTSGPEGNGIMLVESPSSKARAIEAMHREQDHQRQHDQYQHEHQTQFQHAPVSSRPIDRVKRLPTPPVAQVMPNFNDLVDQPKRDDAGLRRKTSMVKKFRDRIGGGVALQATSDPNRVEAPVTFKAYMLCVFASFGGVFFGYDSGYMNGCLAMPFFIHTITGKPYPPDTPSADFAIPAYQQSLITSILSAGTFFGAIIAGDLADYFGRRITIVSGCGIFIVGCCLQTASAGLGLLVAGRLISGFGVGFISAIIILYMSEVAPRKVRGAIVAGYQFCVTIGLLLASCVVYGTQNRRDSGSYRIPIGVQFAWALILGTGLLLSPESPRWYVKRGRIDDAATSLSRVRGQPRNSAYIQEELAEIIANHEYELELIPAHGYLSSWAVCFSGGLRNPASNLRRTILGTSLQMMQQWTGVNFIFYFGTVFFKHLGTIHNPFLISLITTLVNVCSTPISFWTIERFGRRPLLIWGALGMLICEFIAGIVGVTQPNNDNATKAQISMICIYIFFFASTWGPGAWVCIGEIFPLPIRSRGVGLSTSSNWFWNCIITVITPYLVGTDKANLGSKVFFIWGSTCVLCFFYAYFLVWETKGLTLEQVDRMMEETNPRNSASWKPHSTYASEMGLTQQAEKAQVINDHTGLGTDNYIAGI